MQNIYSKLVTKAATGRILGVKPANIARLVPVEDGRVMVELKNGKTEYIAAHDYVVHFAEFRKESAKELTAAQVSDGKFMVYNPKTDGVRVVSIVDGEIQCSCDDYKNSSECFETEVACKHVYAVLSLLGFPSLQTYINARESAAEWKEINAGFAEVAARVDRY